MREEWVVNQIKEIEKLGDELIQCYKTKPLPIKTPRIIEMFYQKVNTLQYNNDVKKTHWDEVIKGICEMVSKEEPGSKEEPETDN